MSVEVWLPPWWDGNYRKHRPPPHVPWEEIRRGTGEGDRIAKYHPALTEQAIESLEMSFIEPDRLGNAREKQFVAELKAVKYFYAHHTNVVGASCGEETNFIRIVRSCSGSVHGYPCTQQELLEDLKDYPKALQKFVERFPE